MSSENAVLTDRTLVISGGSRGIGLAIALAAARQGANLVLLAKTSQPHPGYPAPCTPPWPRWRPRAERLSP